MCPSILSKGLRHGPPREGLEEGPPGRHQLPGVPSNGRNLTTEACTGKLWGLEENWFPINGPLWGNVPRS